MKRLPFKSDRFSRRGFLAGLGVSGAMMPLIWAERVAGAASNGAIVRFCAVTYGNGARPNFYPTGNDLSAPLGKSIAALEPLKAKMSMPIGLDYTNILDDGFQYDGHFTYCATLTGTRQKKSESRQAMGPSIDQMIADNYAKTVQLKMPLITFGIRSVGDGVSTSWRSAGVQNPASQSAAPVFSKLFSTPNMAPQQIDNLLKRRQSVLDYVGKDLAAFGKRLGTDDRMKIDQHTVSVRDLETQLSAQANAPAMPTSCSSPDQGGSDVPGYSKAMFDIIAMAFKCDLSRSATVTISDDGGGDGTSFPFAGSSGDFHQTAHASNDAQMSSISNWIFTNIASMATQLDAAKEPSGTVLDNSVIITASNMDEGANHYNGKIPVVVLGSGGGYLKYGVVARYSKMPHNKLLTTVCNACGVNVTTVGDAKYAGTLPELIK